MTGGKAANGRETSGARDDTDNMVAAVGKTVRPQPAIRQALVHSVAVAVLSLPRSRRLWRCQSLRSRYGNCRSLRD